MDEQKEQAQAEPTETVDDTDVGLPTKEEEAIVAEAKAENDRKAELEKAEADRLTREEKLMERKEALAKLGGGSPAGTRPSAPKEMTDTEYAEALERGEVNPLKEDGFLK